MNNLTTFSRRLKDKRESLGLTQKQLGEKIGVTSQAISAYEKNTKETGKSPTLDKSLELANALGVTLDWLCGLDSQHNEDIVNYNQAVELIEKLVKFIPKTIVRSQQVGNLDRADRALITIKDSTLITHFYTRDKMLALLNSGAIEKTLYDMWYEGEKARLKSVHVHEIIYDDNKGDDNGDTEE